MKSFRLQLGAWSVIALIPMVAVIAQAQSASNETLVTNHGVSRMLLDKQYHGDLEATGSGQMLTAGTEVKGSGAYVAIEKVTGSLKGRTGTFVLQHSGTMTQNVPQLIITVVPDSGTGQLKGLTGKMTITIAPGGKHSYDFEYSLNTN
jgi:hypothetical protein